SSTATAAPAALSAALSSLPLTIRWCSSLSPLPTLCALSSSCLSSRGSLSKRKQSKRNSHHTGRRRDKKILNHAASHVEPSQCRNKLLLNLKNYFCGVWPSLDAAPSLCPF